MTRIVYLTAGAATRFCGSCLHDNTLARALSALGEDILLVPTYTPLRTDEDDASLQRVFFGGVNVYLQEKWALFRHTPWFIDRLFDRPGLLNWLSRRSAGMEAAKLGALTVSTLEGERGRQRKELEKLVRWLETEARPEVVHLSNALLLGMAPAIKRRLRVPLVCSLSGEDLFVEQLTSPHYEQARKLLRQQAQCVDAFVAYNYYFADFMADYLSVDRGRIEVIRHGLDLNGHAERPPQPKNRPGRTIIVGYFSRIAPEKGLLQLVEAFARLEADGSLPMQLLVGGYKSAGDEPYFQQVMSAARERGIADRLTYAGELDRAGKIALIQSVDVMSVPTVYHESKGLSLLESLANGVPVVVPRHGVFPELIEHTGGGLLCEPGNIDHLAGQLKQLIQSPELRALHGNQGFQAVRKHYTAQAMAQRHRDLYASLMAAGPGPQPPARP